MKRLYTILVLAAFLTACHKEELIPVTNPNPVVVKKDFILAGEKGIGIYAHDISPDWDRYAYGLAGDSINIDLNADHVADISIKYATVSAPDHYITETTVSCLNGASVSLAPKNPDEIINAATAWTSSTSLLSFTKIDFTTNDTTVTGPWVSTIDKYLGVKITKNGQSTYGWVRMTLLVHPATVYVQDIIVKDFACLRFE